MAEPCPHWRWFYPMPFRQGPLFGNCSSCFLKQKQIPGIFLVPFIPTCHAARSFGSQLRRGSQCALLIWQSPNKISCNCKLSAFPAGPEPSRVRSDVAVSIWSWHGFDPRGWHDCELGQGVVKGGGADPWCMCFLIPGDHLTYTALEGQEVGWCWVSPLDRVTNLTRINEKRKKQG